jgi:hypothetical protein
MKHYGFRHKILMLAVALVFITQLVMLVPVLDLISRDSDAQADRTVGLGHGVRSIHAQPFGQPTDERRLDRVRLPV